MILTHDFIKAFIVTLDIDDEKRAVLERYRSEQASLDESCDPVRTARLAEQSAYQARNRIASLSDMLTEAVEEIVRLRSSLDKLEKGLPAKVEEIIAEMLTK